MEIGLIKNDKQVIRASLDDALHLSDDQKARQKAIYASQGEGILRNRYYGDAVGIGGGLVFDLRNLESLKVSIKPDFLDDPWRRHIGGLDISHGGRSASAHPNAVCFMAIGDDGGYYVYRAHRFPRGLDFANLCANILDRARFPTGDTPMAWGRDALQQHGEGSFADILRSKGLNLLREPAALPNGRFDLDPQYAMIQDLMDAGRIFFDPRYTADLLEELAGLERDDNGNVIPVRDDVLSALRYALLCVDRFARTTSQFHGMRAGRSIYRSAEPELCTGVNPQEWEWLEGPTRRNQP